MINYEDASRINSNYKQNNKERVFGGDIIVISDIDQWITDNT